MTTKSLISAALVALLCASAQAAITLSPGSSPYFSVPSVVDFSPDGFSMTGMRVTAYFSNGSQETVFWQSTSAIAGEAVGSSVPGWSLKESGDTFGVTSIGDPANTGIWYLYNDTSFAITKLVLEGSGADFGGRTLFDVQGDGSDGFGTTPGRNPSAALSPTHKGTAGSELGSSFEDLNSSTIGGTYANLFPPGSLTVNATYLNAVKLDSATLPLEDLFTTLEIVFGPTGLLPAVALAEIGLFEVVPYQFRADTDLWGQGTTITNNPSPEPTSLCLFAGLGLIGAWRCRHARRRSRAQS